jgi:hypothetical protein
MANLDWKAIEEQVYDESLRNILAFVQIHQGVMFSCLAYHVMAYAGLLQLCFETPEHAIEVAWRNEREAILTRQRVLTTEYAWAQASEVLRRFPITLCPHETGEFAYAVQTPVIIEGIDGVDFETEYPPLSQGGDTYIDGHLQLVLWKVIDRLVTANAFKTLSISSPFAIGYQLHGDNLVITRMVNWPQGQTQGRTLE